jgi:predicted nucleotidyltransferase component of viral defense system
VRREIAHAYDEAPPSDGAVQCYAFAEVFTEKLRALGQRTRPRDLYDVVNLYRRADLRETSQSCAGFVPTRWASALRR